MASNSTELLEYLNEHILECVICKGQLKQPKALPCLHVFCRDCIGKYIDENTKNGQYTCPTCRENHDVLNDGANSLRDAFLQKSLMEVSNLVQKKPVPCTSCETGNDAKSACPTCGDFFCSDCELSHKSLRLTKSHELTPIEELGDAKMLAKFQKTRYGMCTVHATEVCKLYCENDQSEICNMCTYEPEHKSHDVITMAAKLQELKAEANRTKVRLDKHIATLKERKQILIEIPEKVKQQEEDALDQLSKRDTELKEMLARFIAALQADVSELSLKYQETAQEQLKQVETEIQQQEKLSRQFEFLESLPVPSALRVASDIIKIGKTSVSPEAGEGNIRNEIADKMLVTSGLQYENVKAVLKSIIGYLPTSVSKEEPYTIKHTEMSDEMKSAVFEIVPEVVWAKRYMSRSAATYCDIAKLCAKNMEKKHGGKWDCLVSTVTQNGIRKPVYPKSSLTLVMSGLIINLFQ